MNNDNDESGYQEEPGGERNVEIEKQAAAGSAAPIYPPDDGDNQDVFDHHGEHTDWNLGIARESDGSQIGKSTSPSTNASEEGTPGI
jgi:hypothetical protein